MPLTLTPPSALPPFTTSRAELHALMESTDPVVGQLSRHDRGLDGSLHSHPRAQLICALASPADIRCRSSRWTLKPGEAAWLPGGAEHAVSADRPQLFHSIYIRPDLAATLSLTHGILPVSRFLAELINRLVNLSHGRGDATTYAHLVPLLISELDHAACPAPDLPLPILMPSDHRLARICQTLLDNPGDRRTLADWALETGSNRRLIERLFLSETGMSFANWRQLCRVHAAAPLLQAGRPVQQVAWDMGYDSPSAFAAMFRKVAGVAPTALRRACNGLSTG